MTTVERTPFCTMDEIKKVKCVNGATCQKIYFSPTLANVYCKCTEGWTGNRCEFVDIPIDYYTGSLMWIGLIPIIFLLLAVVSLVIYFLVYKFCPSAKCKTKKKKSSIVQENRIESDLKMLEEDPRDIEEYSMKEFVGETSLLHKTMDQLKFIDEEDNQDDNYAFEATSTVTNANAPSYTLKTVSNSNTHHNDSVNFAGIKDTTSIDQINVINGTTTYSVYASHEVNGEKMNTDKNVKRKSSGFTSYTSNNKFTNYSANQKIDPNGAANVNCTRFDPTDIRNSSANSTTSHAGISESDFRPNSKYSRIEDRNLLTDNRIMEIGNSSPKMNSDLKSSLNSPR